MNDFTNVVNVNFDDVDNLKKNNEEFKLGRTMFNFMDDHFGVRPGCIHALHSKTSGGKTSLARSLLVNITMSEKVLWYATEESLEDWKLKFNKLPLERNTMFLSEENIRDLDVDGFLKYLETQIISYSPKIVIFDNITTSKFYNDQKIEVQNRVIQELKQMLKRHGIGMIVIAHYNGNDPRSLFTSKDVRGSKTFPNISEYWYNLHRLRLDEKDKIDGKDVAILHVEKARAHSNSDTAYQLFYDKNECRFLNDTRITWGAAKEILEKQIKIGSKK